MRKISTIIVAVTVATLAFTACSKNTNNEETTPVATTEAPTTEAPTTEEATTVDEATAINSAADVLNNVWNTYPQEQQFPAMGGLEFPAEGNGSAGLLDLTENKDSIMYMLYVPEDQLASIDEVASLAHAMNANTFTGGAYHIAEGADIDAFVSALKDSILNTQWMCGFPEKLYIFTVNGEYVVSAFGKGEIIENFKNTLLDVYGDNAVLVVDEEIL